MKRWMWILLGILGLSLLGEARNGIEELEPVQVLYAECAEGTVTLGTDTGSSGRGRSLETALLDMRRKSDRRIFLETAEQLLLGEGGESLLPQLTILLRPAVRVLRAEGKPDLSKAASYLRTHETKTTLADLRAGRGVIPRLYREEGGVYFAGADGKTEEHLDPGRSRSAPGPSGSRDPLGKRAGDRHGGGSGAVPGSAIPVDGP